MEAIQEQRDREAIGMDVDKYGNPYKEIKEEIPFASLHSFVTDLK